MARRRGPPGEGGRKLEGIGRGELSSLHPGFVFVKRGDVALTRALLERGAVRIIGRRGNRVEQLGVGALPEAIEQARRAVEATAGARAVARERGRVTRAKAEEVYRREFAEAVRRLFPRIPAADLEAVVAQACEVSSGRVGRTSAAKNLEREPVQLAVRARVRHAHTDYDTRLRRAGLNQRFGRASAEDRKKARAAVKARIEAVLRSWEGEGSPQESPGITTGAAGGLFAGLTPVGPDRGAASVPGPPPEPARPRPRLRPPEPSERETRPRHLWERPLG